MALEYSFLFQSLIVFSNTVTAIQGSFQTPSFQSLIVFSNTRQANYNTVHLARFQSLIVFSNTPH